MKITPTPQEVFSAIYHLQSADISDKERYNLAVKDFIYEYKMQPPYTSYNSFKNYQTKSRPKQPLNIVGIS
jgi:hypothetical protein|tara:strand:- start:33060 stop:33272 length:213 start_codon:yes stop_codon:yes gene_type:complete